MACTKTEQISSKLLKIPIIKVGSFLSETQCIWIEWRSRNKQSAAQSWQQSLTINTITNQKISIFCLKRALKTRWQLVSESAWKRCLVLSLWMEYGKTRLTSLDSSQSSSKWVKCSSCWVAIILNPFHGNNDAHHHQCSQWQVKWTPAIWPTSSSACAQTACRYHYEYEYWSSFHDEIKPKFLNRIFLWQKQKKQQKTAMWLSDYCLTLAQCTLADWTPMNNY